MISFSYFFGNYFYVLTRANCSLSFCYFNKAWISFYLSSGLECLNKRREMEEHLILNKIDLFLINYDFSSSSKQFESFSILLSIYVALVWIYSKPDKDFSIYSIVFVSFSFLDIPTLNLLSISILGSLPYFGFGSSLLATNIIYLIFYSIINSILFTIFKNKR